MVKDGDHTLLCSDVYFRGTDAPEGAQCGTALKGCDTAAIMRAALSAEEDKHSFFSALHIIDFLLQSRSSTAEGTVSPALCH